MYYSKKNSGDSQCLMEKKQKDFISILITTHRNKNKR